MSTCWVAKQVRQVDPNLVGVNACLHHYKAAWDELVDSWLVIQIKDPQVSCWCSA